MVYMIILKKIIKTILTAFLTMHYVLAFSNNENKSIINQIEAEMKKRQLNCN